MQKQEAAVGENETEETLEECMIRVKAENPDISDEDARAKCTAQPAPEPEGNGEAEKSLHDQILAVMKDYGNTIVAQVKKDIEAKMQTVIKDTRDEMVTSIRKGLGLEKDPTVHLSEVEDLVRKIILEKSPHGKRSATETPDKPAAGAEDLSKGIVKPADKLYEELTKNRTLI
jgi:hypothetical protein